MTTLTGFTNPSSFGGYHPDKNPDVEAFPAINAPTLGDGHLPGFGDLINTQPVSEIPRTLAGFVMASFDTDYYNTIHITPNPVDLGNVVDGQTVQVNIWNAYFTQQLLDTITATGDEGLTLTEPVASPTVYLPLENRTYTLTVSIDGPAIIDADYVFPFPSDIVVLHVSGARTIVFAFPPNWAEPVLEWYQWLTDVLTAYDGGEQRRGLRALPRWGMEYEAALSGDAKRLFDTILHDRQALSFALPLWPDVTRLDQPAGIGDTTLYLDTTDLGFQVGQRAILFNSPLDYESFEVTAITSNTLVADTALAAAWPAGARIYPMRYVLLTQQQKLNRENAHVRTARVAFEMIDGEAGTAAESGVNYRDEPVYLAKPNWAADLTDEFRRKLQVLDYLTYNKFVQDESKRPTIFQQMNWPLLTRAARRAFVQWLFARAGKYNGVWIPTHNADLVVVAPIGAADSTIDVRYCGYSLFTKQAINRRDIVIWTRSGTTYLRRIASSSKISATVERLSIGTDVLGVGLALADIVKVSFLMYMRLASDRVELRHLTATVAESEPLLQTVDDDI
jgi:hypothetical protein